MNLDRAAAVLSGCYVADFLEQILKALLAKGKRVDDMFSNQGALGSLVAKINLAFALGLASPAVCRDLDLIRKVRNHFAHLLSEASFPEPRVNDWVGRSRCLAMNNASKVALDTFARQRYYDSSFSQDPTSFVRTHTRSAP
jgi:DNA-binding MltR family transcriptional regulator